MSDATRLATDAGSRDPSTGLRAVTALRLLLERLESLQVASARTEGWSWQQIAEHLGVSKQALHKKYAVRRFGGRGRTSCSPGSRRDPGRPWSWPRRRP